ncbi:BQ5605_C002g01071 [Microbotryum silenes-dioicae]|uniref:BQ5605_C002g01071 protein n=1 Tax=Microbotryum silenes-dioicae TaxID=796604 RepID=A0A2X0M1K1_9BASI|nr:BQ5605_C002g01071 [Microbotryum silenes-dioicae]
MSSTSADKLQPVGGRVFAPIDTSKSIGDGLLELTDVLVGGGVFGYDYNTSSTLESSIPEDTLRLAFRYGISGIDTSPYYTTSETVIGKALAKLAPEFPRSSYQLITKIGRYGRAKADFDYSPERVRQSVAKSCELMGTDYLDAVYCHDVEFVSEQVGEAGTAGWTVDSEVKIRKEDLDKWGLAEGDEGKIRGPGDEKVLGALKALFELKKEGKICAIGFSGYPLPTLLRLARLSAAKLQPIDIMQSYCHHTLQNTTLTTFLPLFYAAGVKQVVSASPLSMGLLRGAGSPEWHPASPELQQATKDAVAAMKKEGVELADVALGYGLASANLDASVGRPTPTVAGFSTPEEVHATMRVYNAVYGAQGESRAGRLPGQGLQSEANQKQLALEKQCYDIFQKSKTLNWGWASGRD